MLFSLAKMIWRERPARGLLRRWLLRRQRHRTSPLACKRNTGAFWRAIHWQIITSVLVICLAGHAIAHPYPAIPLPNADRWRPNPSLPEDFVLAEAAPTERPSSTDLINLPGDVPRKIVQCWSPPGSQAGRAMQATIKISFRADGTPLGPPVFTYVNAAAGSAARADIVKTVEDAVKACSPLPFTAALGRAIAGRLFLIRFVSNPKPQETPL